MHMIAGAMEMGLKCAFLDIEGTSDEEYQSNFFDPTEILYSNPDGMEEALQMALDLQKSGVINLVVLDSIAAMSPNKEQEVSMEDTIRMGIPQQLLSLFFRKALPKMTPKKSLCEISSGICRTQQCQQETKTTTTHWR